MCSGAIPTKILLAEAEGRLKGVAFGTEKKDEPARKRSWSLSGIAALVAGWKRKEALNV